MQRVTPFEFSVTLTRSLRLRLSEALSHKCSRLLPTGATVAPCTESTVAQVQLPPLELRRSQRKPTEAEHVDLCTVHYMTAIAKTSNDMRVGNEPITDLRGQ